MAKSLANMSNAKQGGPQSFFNLQKEKRFDTFDKESTIAIFLIDANQQNSPTLWGALPSQAEAP